MSRLERLYAPPEIGAPGRRAAAGVRRDLILSGLFVLTMAGLFAVAVAFGWFMARRALAGVETVTRAARRIAADGQLAERVPAGRGGDEIERLAATFNRMLDRIQALVNGIKEMTDNIAHDLKSPITRIRGQAEVALTSRGAAEEYEAMAASAVEECDRLLEMINTMLFISRSEAGLTKPEITELDLAAVVRDACGLFQSLAEDKQIVLTWEAPTQFEFSGDVRLIQRMLGNLLDNAITYSERGRAVRVTAGERGAEILIQVQDEGCGIASKHLPRLFERFYRVDKASSRDLGGTGLGLAIVKSIIENHQGRIWVDSAPGKGATFTAILPVFQG